MNESTCKAALAKALRAGLPADRGVVYRHEDTFTGGIPDLSISLRGRTVWVEVKLDRPGRPAKVTALQAAALTRLDGVLVRYVLTKAGGLEARVTDYGDAITISVSGTRAEVHEMVARALLARVRA